MLWFAFALLLVLWMLGVVTGVGGSLVHVLLVCAVALLAYGLATGKEATF